MPRKQQQNASENDDALLEQAMRAAAKERAEGVVCAAPAAKASLKSKQEKRKKLEAKTARHNKAEERYSRTVRALNKNPDVAARLNASVMLSRAADCFEEIEEALMPRDVANLKKLIGDLDLESRPMQK